MYEESRNFFKEMNEIVYQYNEALKNKDAYKCRELMDKCNFVLVQELFDFGEKINSLEYLLKTKTFENENGIREILQSYKKAYDIAAIILKKMQEIREKYGFTNAPTE